MNFLKKLMSLEEERYSIVIWMYVITHMVGLWRVIITGEYPDNLMYLDQFYVGAIIGYAGIKIFKKGE
jgi:multisubunit Na+/H+ antiporter MnhF subunit